MTKKIILIAAVVILLAIITQGASPTIDWYQVEDWEIEFCNKWGGKQKPSEMEIISGYFAYGMASMTLQGKKTYAGNETYYEIGYYIEPYSKEMYFELYMINEKSEYKIDSGTLDISAGVSDYVEMYLPEDYTHLKLIHSAGELKVPIVEALE